MNKVVWSGVAAAVLATSSLAVAAQTMAPPPPPHEMTFAEVKADADRMWDRLDANHDGRIDAADRDARVLERFAQWDTNHDGVVSKEEFLAHVHARKAEWKAREHHGPGMGGPDLGGKGPDGPMGPHRGGHMMGMMIIGPAMHEARKDGTITRAAFDAAIKARFDRIDTNHDGKLSREEMRAARPHDGPHGPWGRPHGEGAMPPPPAGQ